MRVKLEISKNGTALYSQAHDITDADSFGKACAQAWWKLRQAQLDRESSIGALMEHLDNNVLDELNGSYITMERA